MSDFKKVQSNILYPETICVKKTEIRVLDTYINLKWLLSHFYAEIRYNMMTRRREIRLPEQFIFPDDIENSALARIDYLATINGMPTKKLDSHLSAIAEENSYHPIIDCLKEKPWDEVRRLDAFIKTIRTTDDIFAAEIIRTWMTAAIAAAHSIHGFTHHGVLVLQGIQGVGKTAWVKALDPINCGAVREGALLDPANKDSVISLSRYWIVELGELDATLNKTDIARIKSYITNQSDSVRFPYAKRETTLIRRTAYLATVNESNFLVDTTGNRRWWTLEVTDIDYQHGFDMQQVWAEVYAGWRNGALTYLPKEMEAKVNQSNTKHERMDPLEEKLRTFYDWTHDGGHEEKTATKILEEIGYNKPTQGELQRCGKILGKLSKYTAKCVHGLKRHFVPIRRNFNQS